MWATISGDTWLIVGAIGACAALWFVAWIISMSYIAKHADRVIHEMVCNRCERCNQCVCDGIYADVHDEWGKLCETCHRVCRDAKPIDYGEPDPVPCPGCESYMTLTASNEHGAAWRCYKCSITIADEMHPLPNKEQMQHITDASAYLRGGSKPDSLGQEKLLNKNAERVLGITCNECGHCPCEC